MSIEGRRGFLLVKEDTHGAAFGLADHSPMACLLAGLVGGLAGTLGGYEFRKRLVKASGGNDLPIALLEDLIAIGGAFVIVMR